MVLTWIPHTKQGDCQRERRPLVSKWVRNISEVTMSHAQAACWNNLLIPYAQSIPIKFVNFPTQIIQFPHQDKPEWPQIICSSKMMINPLRKPSAHPDNIPIPSNIFPSPKIIAHSPDDKFPRLRSYFWIPCQSWTSQHSQPKGQNILTRGQVE